MSIRRKVLRAFGTLLLSLLTAEAFLKCQSPISPGLLVTFVWIGFLGFFIPVFASFLQTGLVDKVPTLIICGMVLPAAIISFFSGMVLDALKQQSRQSFEMQLHGAANRYKELLHE